MSAAPSFIVKECKIPLLTTYPVIRPTETNITFKSFKQAVDFHPEGKLPCQDTWYRDLKSSHIRNKRLLDLPYKEPKCCSEIYNMIMDRQKLKKIQKYGLTRPVRTRTFCPKVEKTKTCETKPTGENTVITKVPECYEVIESSSDEGSEYESCKSGSVSICSGCDGETRTKMHKIMKKDLGKLLHTKEEFCKGQVAEEIKKHKLGRDFKLKLNKVF